MTSFKDFGLDRNIMKALLDLGFEKPSPIQEQTIPLLMNSKKDLIALAQTGTGKTAAFALPILNQIKSNSSDLQVIVLCPTRELCLQLAKDTEAFAKYSKKLSVTAVYGGEKIDFQIRSLKKGTNIVVGTPGRVHDLIRRKVLKLQNIKWVVLDEADEMLDMGFKDDLDAILAETPSSRQTLLFSATISQKVRAIAKKYMKEADEISVSKENGGADKVSHEYYVVSARDRFEALKRIVDFLPGVYGILFCRTRRETQDVADKLKRAGYDAEALHGDISQNMRTKIMDRFKKKNIRLLVATDVAARGIDVENLSHVINYNLPDQNESYTHRSGRTGRADKSGVSISIVLQRDRRRIREIESRIGKQFEQKQVPSGKEVCLKQIDSYLQDLAETEIEKIDNEVCLEETIERLKKIKKDDLIKHVIAQKFGSLMQSYQNSHDLNSKAKDFACSSRDRKAKSRDRLSAGSVEMKINLGKKNHLDVKGMFALLNSNKKLKGIEVGKIKILPTQTIFSVEERRAQDVMKYLHGSSARGRKLIVSQAEDSGKNYSSKKSQKKVYSRGSGNSRNYKGKRKNYKR